LPKHPGLDPTFDCFGYNAIIGPGDSGGLVPASRSAPWSLARVPVTGVRGIAAL
jgi:hypothetical protein